MPELDLVTISPNMIKLFEECPLKFYYRYVENIPAPNLDKGFQTGKDIHAIASYYLKGADILRFETALDDKEKPLWSKLKSCSYFNYEIVGVEKSINLKLGDFWLGGRIDAVVKSGGDYFILDYKTGGVEEDMRFDPQTMVYLMMCDDLIENYETLSFVYLDLKNNREVKIRFSDELKREYTEKLLNICGKIKTFNYSTHSRSEDCRCEYYNLCRFM